MKAFLPRYVYSVHGSRGLINYGFTQDQLVVSLSVSRRMRINSIQTLLPVEIEDLKFKIQRGDDDHLALGYDLLQVNGKWRIKLKNAFEADPASIYRLSFNFQPFYFDPSCLLSNQVEMVHKHSYDSILFQFSLTHNCVHCVHGIDFCI